MTQANSQRDTPNSACRTTAPPAPQPLLATPNPRLIRFLEMALILFALYYGGVCHLVYRLISGLPITAPTIEPPVLVANFLRQAAAVGILGYVFAHNSKRPIPAPPGTANEPSTSSAGGLRVFELVLVLFVGLAVSIFSSALSLVERGPFPTSPNPATETLDAQLAGILELSARLVTGSEGTFHPEPSAPVRKCQGKTENPCVGDSIPPPATTPT